MYYYTKVCGYLSLVHNTILLITLFRKKVLVDDWKTLKQQFQLYINYGNYTYVRWIYINYRYKKVFNLCLDIHFQNIFYERNDSIHLIILLLIPSDSGYIVNHFEQYVFLKNLFYILWNIFIHGACKLHHFRINVTETRLSLI